MMNKKQRRTQRWLTGCGGRTPGQSRGDVWAHCYNLMEDDAGKEGALSLPAGTLWR